MSGKVNTIRIARKLQEESYNLFYPQDQDEYSYINKYQEINSRIVLWRNKLARTKGDTVEEEAEICLALLMGCNAYIRDDSGIRDALSRTYGILPRLNSGILKCQLLIFCYGEEYDEKMLQEVNEIINTWKERDLSVKERRIVAVLNDIEENNIRLESID